MDTNQSHELWSKGKLVGQKPATKPKELWAIRIHLQNEHQLRDLAMFDLAIDSKLRGCDLVNLQVRDVMHADQILPRAMAVQRQTKRPVQFEMTEPTRAAVRAWIEMAHLKAEHYLFPSRLAKSPHVSTLQYARAACGSGPMACGDIGQNDLKNVQGESTPWCSARVKDQAKQCLRSASKIPALMTDLKHGEASRCRHLLSVVYPRLQQQETLGRRS